MPPIDTENLNKILDYWFKQNGKVHKKDKLLEYIVKRIYLTVYQKEKDPKSPSKDKSLRTEAIEAYKNVDKSTVIFRFIKQIADGYRSITIGEKGIDLEYVLKMLLQQKQITAYISENNIKLPSEIKLNINTITTMVKLEEEKKDRQQFIDIRKEICKELFEKRNTGNKPILMEKELSNDNDDHIDYIYKLDDKIYRIIVGKKRAVATKGFSWVDKSILGDIGKIKLEEKNYKCKLEKIAQGKTSEKYTDTKADSGKQEFSFRYKIYLGGHTFKPVKLGIDDKQAILKHFGYTVTKQLGEGGYGTAYVDENAEKNGITRVIKVCLNDEIEIKKEWKGVNTAYKFLIK